MPCRIKWLCWTGHVKQFVGGFVLIATACGEFWHPAKNVEVLECGCYRCVLPEDAKEHVPEPEYLVDACTAGETAIYANVTTSTSSTSTSATTTGEPIRV